jgi:hypothetical protein
MPGMLGLLFCQCEGSKIRERNGAQAFDGPHLMGGHNNQQKVGISGGSNNVVEGEQLQQKMWGGLFAIIWGWRINQQKLRERGMLS